MGLCSTNDEWCFRSDAAIKDIPGCFKLVDDILVAAPTYEVLYQHLALILENCVKIGLSIHPLKFLVGRTLNFAGFRISPAGIEADPEKTCLLYTSPSPRDKRQSRMPSSA